MSENMNMSRGSANGNGNGNGGGGGKRRLADFFVQNKCAVDYKDTDVLRRFISPEGKILPSRRSGLIACNQRKVTRAIKLARSAGLLPFSTFET